MATAEVIRDASETILAILRNGLSPRVDPLRVFLATPDEFGRLRAPTDPTVTVFLYHVGLNASMRNGPRRTLSSGKTTRQPLPLELAYLVTPWAKQTTEELSIAGHIMQLLYDAGELSRSDLAGSSWEEADTMQILFESLPLEEHYRVWDASDVPYRLSLAYTARVIGIASSAQRDEVPIVDATFRTTPLPGGPA